MAALALVVSPLLHAEAHLHEQEQDGIERSAAFDRVFDIVFSGGSSGRRLELYRAVARVLGEAGVETPHLHGRDAVPHDHGGGPGAPRHSHGPGPHGQGSLHHFAAALHAAPARQPFLQPRLPALSVHPPRVATLFVSRTGWLVEQSQGPPRS